MEKSSALSCQRSFTIVYANVNSATFKRFNVSIFSAKLSTIIHLTNQVMIPESGITRRRHSKNVHRLPFFLSFLPPYHAWLAPLVDFFISPYTPPGSMFTGYPSTPIININILPIVKPFTSFINSWELACHENIMVDQEVTLWGDI